MFETGFFVTKNSVSFAGPRVKRENATFFGERKILTAEPACGLGETLVSDVELPPLPGGGAAALAAAGVDGDDENWRGSWSSTTTGLSAAGGASAGGRGAKGGG